MSWAEMSHNRINKFICSFGNMLSFLSFVVYIVLKSYIKIKNTRYIFVFHYMQQMRQIKAFFITGPRSPGPRSPSKNQFGPRSPGPKLFWAEESRNPFKNSGNIQKTEGGLDIYVSNNQFCSVTLNELEIRARECIL